MTKQERLEWLKERHQAHEAQFGDLPVGKAEIQETVGELDAFREFQKDVHSESEFLTSDEL